MKVERKVKRKSERHVELKRCDSAIHNLPTHIYLYKEKY